MPSPKYLGKSVDVAHVVHQARQFITAMERCLPPGLPDGIWEGPTSAGMVCGAFGIELWLKAFHSVAHPDKRVPGGHNLSTLFDTLPEALRGELLAATGYPDEVFREALTLNAHVFETWRYSYEHYLNATDPVEALEADAYHLTKLAAACELVYAGLRSSDGKPYPTIG